MKSTYSNCILGFYLDSYKDNVIRQHVFLKLFFLNFFWNIFKVIWKKLKEFYCFQKM
jgi:hypothetical protein